MIRRLRQVDEDQLAEVDFEEPRYARVRAGDRADEPDVWVAGAGGAGSALVRAMAWPKYAYAPDQHQVAAPRPRHRPRLRGGRVVSRDFAQMGPGDVIGFSYTKGGHVFHVGLYLGGGRMVNSDSHGVSIASLTHGYYETLAWRIVRLAGGA